MGKKTPEGMSKRRHWLVVDGKGVARYKYTYFFIKTMKNVNFGGKKKTEGMPTRRHWLGGRGESN